MPRPLKRRELIRRLRELGFEGPYAGAKHQFMIRGALKLRIPNPRRGEIGSALLSEIIRQAGLTPDDWER